MAVAKPGGVRPAVATLTVQAAFGMLRLCVLSATVSGKTATFGWGYLDMYPDYMTQGTSLDDLKEHLLDLYSDLSSGAIPAVRQHAELEVA